MEREIAALTRAYEGLHYDDVGFAWVYVPTFPLSASAWQQQNTELLLVVPAIYPFCSPGPLYIRSDLMTNGGRRLDSLLDPPQVFTCPPLPGWIGMEIHVSAWVPHREGEDGDSLISFLDLVRALLEVIGLRANGVPQEKEEVIHR